MKTESLTKLKQAIGLLNEVVKLEETTVNPQTKQELIISDLSYVTSVRLPKIMFGYPTSYAPGMLTHKRTGDGKLRFYSDSHIYTGGKIYEFSIPPILKKNAEVIVTSTPGDIYGGKKLDIAGRPIAGENGHLVSGLRYSENVNGFYWNYGANYSPNSQNNPSYGLTNYNNIEVSGPWTPNFPSLKRRGGTVSIPSWFSNKFGTTGIGLGFGGYYSIIEGGSAGPCLIDSLGKTLIDYPWSSNRDHSKHCRRPADYKMIGDNTWLGRDGGTWTAADEVGGDTHSSGATWIDLPDKHAFLVWCSQGTGNIMYDDGGVKCDSRINRLYNYSIDDLGKVASGQMKPWEIVPRIYDWNIPDDFNGRVCGVTFDSVERKLYTIVTEAYESNGDWYPILQIYNVL